LKQVIAMLLVQICSCIAPNSPASTGPTGSQCP